MTRFQLPRIDSDSDAKHDDAVESLIAALWPDRHTTAPQSDGEPRIPSSPSAGPWDD